jgi:hypothetical protein
MIEDDKVKIEKLFEDIEVEAKPVFQKRLKSKNG